MKKLLFSALLLVACLVQTQAQDTKHVIRFSPFGVVNKVRLQYEYALTDNVSAGAIGSYYYALFPGIKLEPFARYYLTNTPAPEGLYLQAKAVGGRFSSRLGYVAVTEHYNEAGEFSHFSASADDIIKKRQFTTGGAGIAIGYQALLGKENRVSIDFNLGAQYVHYPKEIRKFREEAIVDGKRQVTTYTPDFADKVWTYTGPGAYFNPMLSFGYSF